MRPCLGKFTIVMGDHRPTGGFKRFQTCAVPAYGLGGGCSEHELRKSEPNVGWCIGASKEACFEGFCKSANANLWDEAYRIVMTKTRGITGPAEQSPEMLKGIIEGLFPRHDPSPWPPFVGQLETRAGDEETISDMELAGIAKSLSVGKVPGPDEAQSLTLKVAISEATEIFRSVVQRCLDEGVSQKFGND